MESANILVGCLTIVATVAVVLLGAAKAGAAEVAHPVYPVKASQKQIERLKQAVAPLMAMPEADMVALVPDKTGFRFMGCPDCDEGTQEGQLTWSITDPHHVTCRYCGMVYPNDKYPEDKILKVLNPVGKEVEYPCWEDETGYRYLFSAKGWRAARTYFSTRAEDLGELYQMTGDRTYARRAALILDAFARHYPGFLVSRDWPHRPKEFALQPPYPNGGGKWGRWASSEVPSNVVRAYDWIYDSGELERLSQELGVDVKARVENDFFRGCIRQNGFMGPTYGNASPDIYLGYATMGRVMGDPSLVHEAVRRSRGLFERRFFVDGFWCEGSVAYHQMTINGMNRVFQALRGYSDPPGYIDAKDGTRFDDLDLERDIPIIARAKRIPEICRYPDGRTMIVHDCWAYFRNLQAPERSASTLLTGVGHAWLGHGQGDAQAQLHLHFSGGYGHEHADNLTLILFAKGLELLPDVGYTHTRYRAWSTSTLCHNTVVIDEQRQDTRGGGGFSDGRLLAFETAFAPVQWVEACGERGYPDLAEDYRRALMLVDAGDGAVYAVDLFRVKGGAQHDWALHGNADYDGTGAVSIPLIPYGDNLLPGVQIRYPEGEADRGDADGRNPSYAFFQNVSRGEVTDGVAVTFTVPERSTGVRTHLPAQAGAEVFLGDAPSFRRSEENDSLLDRHRMPIFLLRRKGPRPLTSRFAAVHEPFDAAPFLENVSLETVSGDENAIAVSIQHHGVTDHIVHRPEADDREIAVGDLRLKGQVGFVRERDGVPEMMGLWGGSELRWGNHVLTGSGVYSGSLTGAHRTDEGTDALVVSDGLPEGDALKGATLRLTFGDASTQGYRIRSVVQKGAQTHVILEDEIGFAVETGGAKHLFFPLREMPGDVTYRILTSAFVVIDGEKMTSVGEASFASSVEGSK